MKYILVILFVLLLAIPCQASWFNDYYADSQGIWEIEKPNDNYVLLIPLGTSKANVVSAMGREPLAVKEGPFNQELLIFNDMLKEPSGLDFYISNDRLVAISIYTNRIYTEKGIAVGASKENVLKAYGDNYSEITVSGHGKGIVYCTERSNIYFCISGSVSEIVIYFKNEWY